MIKIIHIASLASLMMLTGCATGRLADLRDCGRFSVGAGPDLGIEARVGMLTHLSLGIGSEDRKRYGYESRYVYGKWLETEGYWPLAFFLPGFLQESTTQSLFAIDTTYCRWIDDGWLINPPPYRIGHLLNFRDSNNPKTSLLKRAMDFELGVAPVLFSLRIGVNPLEIADFLLGFIGLDIADDDEKEPTTPSSLRR
jgi:hypothetical protein